MSVLIKGLEIPTSCYKCQLKIRNGMDIVCPVAHKRFSAADVNIYDYRLDNCPLVPVPPHGRLGDLDKLADNMRSATAGMAHRAIIMHEIRRAPTIIPAEEE